MKVNIFAEVNLQNADEALHKLESLLLRQKLRLSEVCLITRISFILGNAAVLERLVELGYEDVADEVALSVVDLPSDEHQ